MANDKDEDEGDDDDEDDNDDEDEGEDDDGVLRANSNSLVSLSTSLVSSLILSLFASSAAKYIASPNPKSMEWLSCCESLASAS